MPCRRIDDDHVTLPVPGVTVPGYQVGWRGTSDVSVDVAKNSSTYFLNLKTNQKILFYFGFDFETATIITSSLVV